MTLKEDYFWIEGDNKSVSFDSRYFGPINKELIIGKAVLNII